MSCTAVCRLTLTFCALAIVCAIRAEERPARPLWERKALEEVVVADFATKTPRAIHEQVSVKGDGATATVQFPARVEAPAVELFSGDGLDLSKMDVLRFDVENSGKRCNGLIFLQDASTQKRAAVELPFDQGANIVALPLWNLRREGGDEKVDVAKVKSIQLAIKRQADAATLKIGKITAQKVFKDAASLRLFDFGDGAVFQGAIPVRATTTYDKARGYGLSGEELNARTWQEPFDLLGDVVGGKNLAFQVDLPDGEYEAQLVAFGVTWQGVRSPSYKVTANDAIVVDKQITPEQFYSFEGHYYGANIFFDPQKGLFEQYHRKYYEPARFDVKAVNGSVKLAFTGCGPRALWIYPKAAQEDGRAFVDGCYAEEAYDIWLRHARVRPHAEPADGIAATEADTKRGYMLFARNYQYRVYPNSLPTKEELIPEAGLSVSCAANEFEPVTFTVRPLKDLGATQVSYSDLVDGEKKISAAAFEKFLIKYFPYRAGGVFYEAVPTMLYPYFDQELKKEWNTQYWATLRVPAGTPAGVYRGTISIKPANGEAATLPLAVTVHPFDLPKTKTECGMWNNTAMGSHHTEGFPDDERAAKLLDVECRNMVEHGLNCYAFGTPRGKSYDLATASAVLDFKSFELIAAAVKKNNMPGRHKYTTWNLGCYGLVRRGGFKLWSPEFNKAYVQIMRDCHDWMTQNGVRGVLQVTDEPREKELNDWNHTRVDSLRLLKLAREVPGMQTMITLMGDKDGFNRPYTPLVPLMDIMASHSWSRSDDSIYLSTVEKIADYWSYNNGFTRFAHGFYLWKSKAMGHWQWVHSWEVCDAHIPVFYSGDSSAVYVFPGGFLNTLKFENIREGIDDHRYLELLQETLAATPKDNAVAIDARKFLETVEKFLPQYPHDTGQVTGAEAGGTYDESKETTYFDPWRAQIAEYLTALKQNRAAKKLDAAWAMFPKQLAAEDRRVFCKLIDKAAAPTVDGKPDDEAWKNAEEVSDFVNLARGVLSPIQTRVKTVCDGEKIYFLFNCIESKYGELKAYAINRDEACWQDDSVEIFMDTKFDKKTYKHVIINCLGTIQDGDGKDGLWNGDIQAAVSKDKGVWRVEVSASLKSLGAGTPAAGAQWGINLCRNRQPQPPETSSWAFVGHSFHNPEGFGKLEFKK